IFRVLDRLAAFAQAYDDVHAGVLEVARVGVALGAVADDGHGLAVQQIQIGVVVVIHGGRCYAVAVAIQVFAGISRRSSGWVNGSAMVSRSASTSLRVAKSIFWSASPTVTLVSVTCVHQSSKSSKRMTKSSGATSNSTNPAFARFSSMSCGSAHANCPG